MKIELFDTTLRDGSQGAGIWFSLEDKVKIAKALANMGVSYIEGGWPGSNPKDEDFFKQALELNLKKAKIVAFGSTRHKDKKAHQDPNLSTLVNSKVKVACIFGKSWDMQVTQALRASLEENLKMIYDSVAFLKSKKLQVIYDAEHFFDGFKNNREYALRSIRSAYEAKADNITFCDTNGGMLPGDIREIVRIVRKELPEVALGIHNHNDSDCAVANSIVAVQEGCTLVQGTINGLGERCGNANLCSILPALQLKLGLECLPKEKLRELTELSRYVDEIANLLPNEKQPYVGRNAFAHKAGIHVSAVARHSKTYEHIHPEEVGNERRILVSELAGKSNVFFKSKELSLDMPKDPAATGKIIRLLKEAENKGFQFEDADGSFALLVYKAVGKYKPVFALKSFRVSVEKNTKGEMVSEATIKLLVNGREEHTVAEGDGPVNALDNSLRKALEKFYPQIKEVSLTDFKVRIINTKAGTAAKVRVLIESSDTASTWGTIGVSENIIEASWQALVDAVEYKILKK
ncbi:MAG: citramalate synthase [Elusimicrobia bacterium]|nr:citramalate synthase [Candidatus Liberimonas magnetica]